MKFFDLGRFLEEKRLFQLAEEELNKHMLVLGGTGSGKSRFLWQLVREHRRLRRGFTMIDLGDLVPDFLADCAKEVLVKGNTDLLKKIHMLQLSPFQMARYNSCKFEMPRCHPEIQAALAASWKHTRSQSLGEIWNRKQNQFDFEGMPRLQRNLTNVFTCVLTFVCGKRLAVSDGEILLNVFHPRHHEVYARLEPHLSREIQGDFAVLHSQKTVDAVRRETESAVNRYRSMFGPLMKAMMSGTGSEPCVDLKSIVERGDYLFVNVSRSLYASREQNIALAGLIIHDLYETVLTMPREKRRAHTLIIDECHMFLGEDIGEMMRVCRKYQLGIVLATQDLASLVKKGLFRVERLAGLKRRTCFAPLKLGKHNLRGEKHVHHLTVSGIWRSWLSLPQNRLRRGDHVLHRGATP